MQQSKCNFDMIESCKHKPVPHHLAMLNSGQVEWLRYLLWTIDLYSFFYNTQPDQTSLLKPKYLQHILNNDYTHFASEKPSLEWPENADVLAISHKPHHVSDLEYSFESQTWVCKSKIDKKQLYYFTKDEWELVLTGKNPNCDVPLTSYSIETIEQVLRIAGITSEGIYRVQGKGIYMNAQKPLEQVLEHPRSYYFDYL